MSEYEVKLDNFTGPLDLLLHLIRTQEISIHDIPIASITEQYLAYLKAMEALSLDVASEFIVMAAWLLAIKSRMLLPRPPVVGEEDVDAEDPRDELVRQLLSYERYKQAASELSDRQSASQFMIGREAMDLAPFKKTEIVPVSGVTIWDLVDAYRKLVSRVEKSHRVAEIKGHVRSVQEMMDVLLSQLRGKSGIFFHRLLGSVTSRQELVSAFLALLELVKDQRVQCRQESPFHDIEIGLVEDIA